MGTTALRWEGLGVLPLLPRLSPDCIREMGRGRMGRPEGGLPERPLSGRASPDPVLPDLSTKIHRIVSSFPPMRGARKHIFPGLLSSACRVGMWDKCARLSYIILSFLPPVHGARNYISPEWLSYARHMQACQTAVNHDIANHLPQEGTPAAASLLLADPMLRSWPERTGCCTAVSRLSLADGTTVPAHCGWSASPIPQNQAPCAIFWSTQFRSWMQCSLLAETAVKQPVLVMI